MIVSRIQINEFRSIERSPEIRLSNLNVIVGANNAGKSSIIKALHVLQEDAASVADIRLGKYETSIELFLEDIPLNHPICMGFQLDSARLRFSLTPNSRRLSIDVSNVDSRETNFFPNTEPNHFIIPFFSKRKTASFQEDVRAQNALSITSNFHYLAAKLSRIANPDYPTHAQYRSTCKEVLGFVLTAIPSTNGQRPGIYVPDGQGKTLPIDQMGEGVANIAALLVYLAESKGKLFLIEELENDLHPKALKALLDLIIVSSQFNQFVISTHSNIVVRHLASIEGSNLYNVKTVPDIHPQKAEIELVPPTVDARMEVLKELGYSFSDFDLWDGWLILEEASAERIIRDYLIPWFVPELTRVRTLSAGGADSVEATFEDFTRLVRFTHLERAYKNRGWVRVDGDQKGIEIIKRLQKDYRSWASNRFSTYTHTQFEQYYPKEFKNQVIQVLNLPRSKEKREAKKKLLDEVRAWLDKEDKVKAKAALEASAKEIIDDLKVIAAQLKEDSV